MTFVTGFLFKNLLCFALTKHRAARSIKLDVAQRRVVIDRKDYPSAVLVWLYKGGKLLHSILLYDDKELDKYLAKSIGELEFIDVEILTSKNKE